MSVTKVLLDQVAGGISDFKAFFLILAIFQKTFANKIDLKSPPKFKMQKFLKFPKDPHLRSPVLP